MAYSKMKMQCWFGHMETTETINCCQKLGHGMAVCCEDGAEPGLHLSCEGECVAQQLKGSIVMIRYIGRASPGLAVLFYDIS
jgi:hypothetical protein